MKKKIVQQEVILMTASKYCHRQFNACYECTNRNNTPSEMLEDACYDGLLDTMLPELMEKSGQGKRLYLWGLRHGKNHLQIELSEFPFHIINRHSIDPQLFLPGISRN